MNKIYEIIYGEIMMEDKTILKIERKCGHTEECSYDKNSIESSWSFIFREKGKKCLDCLKGKE